MADFSFPQNDIPGLLGPNRQAMLGAAAGLLNAGGFQPMRPSIGAGAGAALAGGLHSYNAAIKSAAELAASQQKGLTDDIKEYQYAVQQGFKGTMQDWLQKVKQRDSENFSLTPQYVRGEDGSVKPLQYGSKGNVNEPKLPAGYTVQGKEPIKMDLGTSYLLLDSVTRQPIPGPDGKGITIPKDVAGEAAERKRGELQQDAKASLPKLEMSVAESVRNIENLKNHPSKNMSVGPVMGHFPGILPGQSDFVERLEQLKGDAFLNAYDTLRGAGAITEAEGLKATVQKFRSGRIKSWPEFEAALNDYERNLRKGLDVVYRRAGQEPPAQQQGGGSMIPGGGQIIGGGTLPPPPEGYR